MKKLNLFGIFMMLSMFVFVSASVASETKKSEKKVASVSSENTLSDVEVKVLTLRVEEIREMDKSAMTKLEKRELRNELKTIKKACAKAMGLSILVRDHFC